MIKIKMLTGPHTGQSRQGKELKGYDPVDLLMSCAHHGWRWEIDISAATPIEAQQWVRADLVGRVILAFNEQRPIHVFDRVFVGSDPELLGQIEDAIADSGRLVRVLRDDDQGLWIVAEGWEQ